MQALGALELLLKEMSRLSGTRWHPVATPTRAPRPAPPPHHEDARWHWYDTQPAEFSGVEITEYRVSAALCRAVFHAQDRNPPPRTADDRQ